MPNRQPVLDRSLHLRARCRHAERTQDALLHELLVGRAGDALDHMTEQRDCDIRVFVLRTDVPPELVPTEKGVELVDRIARIGGRAVGRHVGRHARQRRAMRGQVEKRDFASIARRHLDARRQMLRDGILQRDKPAIDEVGEQRACEHLGDRSHLEDRLRPERLSLDTGAAVRHDARRPVRLDNAEHHADAALVDALANDRGQLVVGGKMLRGGGNGGDQRGGKTQQHVPDTRSHGSPFNRRRPWNI